MGFRCLTAGVKGKIWRFCGSQPTSGSFSSEVTTPLYSSKGLKQAPGSPGFFQAFDAFDPIFRLQACHTGPGGEKNMNK